MSAVIVRLPQEERERHMSWTSPGGNETVAHPAASAASESAATFASDVTVCTARPRGP